MNTDLLIRRLEGWGYEPKLASSQNEVKIACRECQDESQRLYMSLQSGLWICHRCQQKGNLFTFFMANGQWDSPWECQEEISEIMGNEGKLSLPLLRPELKAPPPVEIPREFILGGAQPKRMLEGRGIYRHWASQFGMGYCLTGYYAYRVIVPVVTKYELRTFVARSWLPQGKPKILTPPNSRAAEALFGYDLIKPGSDLIVVEGVFDALRVMDAFYGGDYSVVATLGAHITDGQRRLLQQTGFLNVILMRDNDEAGRTAQLKETKELLAAMMNVKVARLLVWKGDPGDLDNDQIYSAVSNAVPGERYIEEETW